MTLGKPYKNYINGISFSLFPVLIVFCYLFLAAYFTIIYEVSIYGCNGFLSPPNLSYTTGYYAQL